MKKCEVVFAMSDGTANHGQECIHTNSLQSMWARKKGTRKRRVQKGQARKDGGHQRIVRCVKAGLRRIVPVRKNASQQHVCGARDFNRARTSALSQLVTNSGIQINCHFAHARSFAYRRGNPNKQHMKVFEFIIIT